MGGTSNDMRSARVGGSPGQIRRKAEGAIARSANQTQILLGTVLPLVRTHGTRASKTNCAGVCVLLNTETEIRLMRRARKTRTQNATAQVKRTLAKPIRHESDLVEIRSAESSRGRSFSRHSPRSTLAHRLTVGPCVARVAS